MGNLALHSAEEPDNLRATTVEVPTIRDNDAALALGARPIQQHEPAARHTMNNIPCDQIVRTVDMIVLVDVSKLKCLEQANETNLFVCMPPLMSLRRAHGR